jgi:hypothetical protein
MLMPGSGIFRVLPPHGSVSRSLAQTPGSSRAGPQRYSGHTAVIAVHGATPNPKVSRSSQALPEPPERHRLAPPLVLRVTTPRWRRLSLS